MSAPETAAAADLKSVGDSGGEVPVFKTNQSAVGVDCITCTVEIAYAWEVSWKDCYRIVGETTVLSSYKY